MVLLNSRRDPLILVRERKLGIMGKFILFLPQSVVSRNLSHRFERARAWGGGFWKRRWVEVGLWIFSRGCGCFEDSFKREFFSLIKRRNHDRGVEPGSFRKWHFWKPRSWPACQSIDSLISPRVFLISPRQRSDHISYLALLFYLFWVLTRLRY